MKNYQKCLYGNLVSINFRKTAVLKKQTNKQTNNRKLKLHSKGLWLQILGGTPVPNFSGRLL